MRLSRATYWLTIAVLVTSFVWAVSVSRAGADKPVFSQSTTSRTEDASVRKQRSTLSPVARLGQAKLQSLEWLASDYYDVTSDFHAQTTEPTIYQDGPIEISGDLVEGGKVYLEIPIKNDGSLPTPRIHPYIEGYTANGELWRANNAQPTARNIFPGERVVFRVEHDLWPGHAGTWTTNGVYLWNDLTDNYWGELYSQDYDQQVSFDVVDLSITHLEITQGIQSYQSGDPDCADIGIPLVSGKPTVVRAYLETSVTSGPAVFGTLNVNQGDGWVEVPADNAPAQAVPDGSFQRDNPRHSLQFTLPRSVLQDSLEIYAEAYVEPEHRVRFPETGSCHVTFGTLPPLRINYVPVTMWDGSQPDRTRIGGATDYFQIVSPAPRVDYSPLPPFGRYIPGLFNDHSHYMGIMKMTYDLLGWPEPMGQPDLLFGWFPFAGNQDTGGQYDNDSEVAWGYDWPENEYYQRIFAHETMHYLGRQHVNEDDNWPHSGDYTIHDVGYDFGYYSPFNPLVSSDTAEVMHSRISVEGRHWVSAYTYSRLYDELDARDEAVAVMTDTPARVLLISGQVDTGGSATLLPAEQLTTTRSISQSVGTEYCLELRDSSETALAQNCFDLDFVDPETGAPLSSDTFVRILPYDPGAVRLVLSQAGDELLSRDVSSHTPSVRVVAPNGGETLDGTVNVEWTANDQDGDNLSFSVSYSHDNGQTWHHLGTYITETQFLVDTSQLPGSQQALFQVTATDGINTQQDRSDAVFTVTEHSPEAHIVSPSDGSTVPWWQPLRLSGYAYDLEDGVLSDTALEWHSDEAGFLGNGSVLLLSQLPIGQHRITFSATDSDGNVAETSVEVTTGYNLYLPTTKRD